MSLRRALALLLAVGALSACQLAVTTSLDEVGCEQEGTVGPPACRRGQICLEGTCKVCSSSERCGNAVDDDCDGVVDDGCGAAGGGGSPVGGAGGAVSVGGSAGQSGKAGAPAGAGGAGAAGAGGSAGGGAGGVAGQAGSGAGGSAGKGAAGGGGGPGGTGGAAGAGGAAAGYGAPCTSAAGCPFGALCVTLESLGESMNGKVCTKACCGSAECGAVSAGAACIPTKSGTGMCLHGAAFGRPSLGDGATGDPCNAHGLCRSGLCENGKCSDVCCKDGACGGSDECVRRDVTVGTPRSAYMCGKPVGGAAANKTCGGDSECRSNACLVHEDVLTQLTFCSAPCCNSQSCGAITAFSTQFPVACKYTPGAAANEWLRTCASVASGGAPTGAACNIDGECRSDFCMNGPNGRFCSDACCGDGDCPSPMKCKPYLPAGSTTALPRCQP